VIERTDLERTRRDATRTALNGVLVAVSVPIVGGAGSVLVRGWPDGPAIATFVLAAIYVVCGGAISLGMIAGSLARRYAASVRLAALDTQLPAARVVVR
jgi:hypothetical protein